MKKRLIQVLTLLLCSYIVHAQSEANPFLADARGTPVLIRKSIVAEGSPYLSEEFITAHITTSAGRTYTNVKARVNIVDCQVEYLTNEGHEMIAIIPITKVHFPALPDEGGKLSAVTLESYGRPMNQKGAEIYAVLDSGKISLLKKITITYRDNKKYGEAVTTRYYLRSETNYILLLDGELKKWEKGKSFFLEAFKDRKEKVEQFITSNNIKCKSTADFRQVLQFYNSI